MHKINFIKKCEQSESFGINLTKFSVIRAKMKMGIVGCSFGFFKIWQRVGCDVCLHIILYKIQIHIQPQMPKKEKLKKMGFVGLVRKTKGEKTENKSRYETNTKTILQSVVPFYSSSCSSTEGNAPTDSSYYT